MLCVKGGTSLNKYPLNSHSMPDTTEGIWETEQNDLCVFRP